MTHLAEMTLTKREANVLLAVREGRVSGVCERSAWKFHMWVQEEQCNRTVTSIVYKLKDVGLLRISYKTGGRASVFVPS